ncbi:hypothetical protein K505DRAFT_323415 [Melanomma pulvis-pyrius CBS 109.77]|uniref:TM7S3/TM198-like domain-containing protein n=1 Tax=Melanomma pulvis-pyrius CBS 109.77 TaxID=1314802 RepID=A0A6A6XJH5_9PLEO|nr:hypothetical protein K505DRAFT_323415 [Melanomma pulvis-pyrius CBS 109.77]
MRSYRILLISLALIFCLHSVAAVPYLLVDRQDGSPSSERSQAPATTDADSPPASSSTPAGQSSARKTQSDRSSTTPTASSSIAVTASTVNQAPVTTASDEPLPSSSTDGDSTNPLPIQPKITPAMGILGAILVISGVAYTVIGIKNKWLYVFFSAAYLSSLAVTVLIVYLMAPSVSNAIQGAFFVAAFLTGVIFGALALVFADITDGLGCLLGGFCLSMWFLTLKEGGLITSTTGRAIFISAMSLAGYCLSFSHHTRTYGLMASISFAGATIVVLGIDCFSRAGWKEFWLYIWNLSPDIFPLFTNTYPMTKAMRAELACVVLFSIFGMISQLKLWKIVKERREKSATARLERDQRSAQEEEALGRKIQDDFTKERAQWEATYGDKSQQDLAVRSSMDSTPKTSSSFKEKRTSVYDSMEMVTLSKGSATGLAMKESPTGPSVTVSVLQDDDIQQIDKQGNPIPTSKRRSTMHFDTLINNRNSGRSSSDAMSHNGLPRSVSIQSSLQASAPPPPVIIPLPFKIPTEDDAQGEQGDNDSVSAAPESVQESLSNRKRFSKRLSGSALKRFSTSRNSPHEYDSEEAMMIPHIEDDRSSLAATFDGSDDGMSLPELSPPQSTRNSMVDEQPSNPSVVPGVSKTSSDVPKDSNSQATSNGGEDLIKDGNLEAASSQVTERLNEEEGIGRSKHSGTGESGPTSLAPTGVQQSLTISTDPKLGGTRSKQSSLSSPALRCDTAVSGSKEDDGRSLPTKSTKSGAPSVNGSHTGNLRGVLPEKLSKVALSYRTNEWAKHLEAAEKPEADDLAEPESPGIKLDHSSGELPVPVSDEILQPLVSKTSSRRVSAESNVYGNSNLIRSASNFSRSSQMEPPYSISRTPSDVASGAVSPLPVVLTPKPSNTLMGKRESLVRNRVSTQSFAPSSTTNLPATGADQENMSLAQRRRLLQNQKPPSASQQWRQSSRGLQGQTQDFNSHQPKRASGSGPDPGKREVLLAGWRESIRQDSPPVQTLAMSEESRRVAMLKERRKKEMEKQQREMAAQQRASMMDNMMRNPGMLDAHRDAMRRMQASANKKL